MNQLISMQRIASYLARFSEEVKLLNAVGDFSINTHAENILVTLLNSVYELKLRNLNSAEKKNVSAIDLLDDSSGVAFQITSTSSIDKVKDCIRKYFRNGMYLRASRLKLYILTKKQESYSQQAIDNVIWEEVRRLAEQGKRAGISFSFSVSNDILDRQDVYKYLYDGNKLDNILQVERYLQQQFKVIDNLAELSSYFSKLKEMFYEVVMDDENGMTLDQIYIDSPFSVIHSALPIDGSVEVKRQKYRMVDETYKVHNFIDDMFRGKNVLKLDVVERLVIILGYPGQGKSSLCKKIMHDYIARDRMSEKLLFYFALRKIRKARDFVFDPLSVLYEEVRNNTGQDIDKFEFNKSFLILDGLDELYMRDNLMMEDIDKLCIELVRLLDSNPELRIILTSRYGYIDDERLTRRRINIIQLNPFTLDMQKEWLAKYRRYHPETWLTSEKLDAFGKKPDAPDNTRGYGHIQELIEQPLLLHMIASVRNEIDEQTNRSGIYQQLFSEVIDRRYATEGQIEALKDVTKEDLRNLIREVAFAIFNTGNEYITRTTLVSLEAVKSFLELLPGTSFRYSIKGVMISFYFKEVEKQKEDDFVTDKSDYAIEFLHKSLREYMTAEKVFYTLKEKFLERKKNDRYVLDDAESVLKVINRLFGTRQLSGEVRAHLKEIIQNDVDLNKQELIDRLLLFLPDLLRNDFTVDFKMDQYPSPMLVSVRCFYGLWDMVSMLGLEQNYLTTEEVKRRFCDYLLFSRDFPGYKLDHQDLSNQDINATFMFWSMAHTNFSGCRINIRSLFGSEIDQCRFDGSHIFYMGADDSAFSGCSFRGASISSFEISNTVIKNTNFSGAVIRMIFGGKRNRFENCLFDGAVFDMDALKRLTSEDDKPEP